MRSDFKLAVRYIIIVIAIYASALVISPEYIKELGTEYIALMQVIIPSVFGLSGWVIKEHMTTKVDKDNDNV